MDDPRIGRTLADFVLREKIGEGAFGEVYRADQLLLDRPAVVKLARANGHATASAGPGEAPAERFLREAQHASRLAHPYAAHVYAFGSEPDGLLWIAMELVAGTTLDDLLLLRGPLPLERMVRLFEMLCEVVQAAHDVGITHRDLKPANIMVLTRAGRWLPKLLDFGVAAIRDEGGGEVAPGSPAYMAPELWRRGAAGDARADQYALGVVAFECLTGRPPFAGPTFAALARAHAREPVPRLGAAFPSGLDDVLARAMAKRADDRFPSVLAFAQALREAAGIAAEPLRPPALPTALRDRIVAEAPQPLAEALGAYEASRNPHQARDALVEAARTLARLLGLFALAARSRAGAPAAGDTPTVVDALQALRAGALTDRAWLALARDLCAPLSDRPAAHPLPELVALVGRDAPLVADVEAVLAVADERGTDDAALRRRVEDGIAALARALEAAAPLLEYQLVVPHGERLERWMGLPRPRRGALAPRPDGIPQGRPLLVDAEARPVLALWPLVQVEAPADGGREELFLLEGSARGGALLVSRPGGYEREDPGVWEWFRTALHDVADPDADAGAAERPPYRGLAAFRADDADRYFGREREAAGAVNRLRDEPLLAVVGPSGTGKSSFVQAGMLPRLPSRWRALTVRPGPAPFAALAARLATVDVVIDAAALRDEPARLADLLRARAAATGEQLLLVVDPLEELFTLGTARADAEAFAAAVAGAATSAEAPARLVIVSRDDFLLRAQELPALRRRLARALLLLATPAPADLLRALVEPARQAGYAFGDDELAAEMVAQVAGQPGALALLSFTAASLWELRDRHFRRLPREAYQSMGGVAGALAHHADAVVDRMSVDEQRLVRRALLRLVTADRTRAVLGLAELVDVLDAGARAQAVVDALIAARLLVAAEGPGGVVQVEIIHECLLSAWPRLVGWLRDEADGARLRDQLGAAARQWDERGRPRGLLWRDEALAEYRLWRRRHPARLAEVERAFADASVVDADRGRRRRRLVVGGAFVVLLAGVAGLLYLNGRTEAQRRVADHANAEARTLLARQYQEAGRAALAGGDVLRAAPYLREAYATGARGPAFDQLVGAAWRLVPEQPAIVADPDAIDKVVFTADGAAVLTAGRDGAVVLWDAATGARLRALPAHTGQVTAAELVPGGRVLTAGLDGVARISELASGRELLAMPQGEECSHAAMSPDGAVVAVADTKGAIRLWDGGNGRPLRELRGHEGRVVYVAFSPDGGTLASAGIDGWVMLWDVASGRQRLALGPHNARVSFGVFSPDGSVVVSGDGAGRVRTWDAHTGQLRADVAAHARQVTPAQFTSDGARFVTGGGDGTARLWETATGATLGTLPGGLAVSAAVLCGGDHRLLATNSDGSARLWDLDHGIELALLRGHLDRVLAGACSPDGLRIATGSFDGVLRLWPARPQWHLATMVGHAGAISSVAFDAAGARVVTAGDDGTARVWSAADGAPLATIADGKSLVSARFAGGDEILIAGEQGAKLVDARTSRPIHAFVTGDWSNHAEPSRDGRLILATVGAEVGVWRRDGVEVARLRGHVDSVMRAAFSPDGTRVVTASADGTARLWAVDGGRELAVLRGHRGVVTTAAFSPDGSRVVTAGVDKTAVVWSVNDARPLVTLVGHGRQVSSAVFSPDGALVLTAGEDGTARVWDPGTGAQLVVIPIGSQGARAAYSPDGTRMATAGLDGSAHLWSVALDPRGAAALATWAECNAPYRLDHGQLVASEVDPAAAAECTPSPGVQAPVAHQGPNGDRSE